MDNSKTIVLTVAFIIASIIFPLWVSDFLEEHGRSDLGKLTRLSIRSGLGILGGLFGLIMFLFKQPEPNPAYDEFDIRYDSISDSDSISDTPEHYFSGICPVCGSNRTMSRIMLEDIYFRDRKIAFNQMRLSKKSGEFVILVGFTMTILPTAIILYMITNFISGSLSLLLIVLSIGIILLLVGITPFIGLNQEIDKIVIEELTCKVCRNKWEVR